MSLRAQVRVCRGSFELDVALEVGTNEILGVLGPNGSGKTTLLRALAGLEPLQAGQISRDEEVLATADSAAQPVEKRRIGYVFQDYRLFPHLSALQNVAYGLRATGTPRAAARRAAQEWLDRFGIGALARHRPGQLSGGQAQRVALARALVLDPALVLLDEPLAALDASTRQQMQLLIRQERRAPTVLVTHDPLEAMVLADRLLVLESGRVVQEGTPAEVARRPATPYVANLMGLNLYRGQAEDGAEHLRRVTVEGGHSLFTLAVDTTGRPIDAGPVLVAVRPSSITLHADKPGPLSARNLWPARITGMELLSDRVRLQTESDPPGLPAMVDLSVEAVAELEISAGRLVWLSAKATDLETYPPPGG